MIPRDMKTIRVNLSGAQLSARCEYVSAGNIGFAIFPQCEGEDTLPALHCGAGGV